MIKNLLGSTRGGIIDIISMNQDGSWKGRYGQKVGFFRFVNVEIMSASKRPREMKKCHAHYQM